MTFYFYDVETSGFNPRSARIMQFGGQRTDKNLQPIGQPDNILVKITADVLPDPDAVLVHGITPQKTLAEGLSEPEFLHYFNQKIYIDDTVFVGFNNIRFDDEFMRFTLWRNFYDAYEWQWKNGCGRWDLLDVARMTRALRPEGINWPFASDGKPSNRLELLAGVNKLDHTNAHDALADVQVSLGLAQLLAQKQPKLFNYLLNLRDKKKIEPLVTKGQPLVYTSGRYPSEFEKTTVAKMVAAQPENRGAIMYDLRIDPNEFIKLSPADLAARWADRSEEAPYFPLKVLGYNRSPAVAPLSVLDKASQERIKLDKQTIETNLLKLETAKGFGDKLIAALEITQPKAQANLVVDEQKVDEQLYDGFIKNDDKTKMSMVRAADATELANLKLCFSDERLKVLLPLYKARNYPASLTPVEQEWWESFRQRRLTDGGNNSRAARYFKRISDLSTQAKQSDENKYLLEELNLYGQSVLPTA